MKNVVIVDDDLMLREYYASSFRVLGYEVITYDCPTDIEQGSMDETDLIVVDLMMPKPVRWNNCKEENELLTGLYFCKHFRESNSQVPIVLFSSLNIKSLILHVSEEVKSLVNVVFLLKYNFEPMSFAQACDEILRTGTAAGLNSTLGRKLARSILMQPNIAGFGCDCKEFLK
ncbi:response regulator [Planktomarina temperata]|nr:response regulator [Planktomarina temperata]